MKVYSPELSQIFTSLFDIQCSIFDIQNNQRILDESRFTSAVLSAVRQFFLFSLNSVVKNTLFSLGIYYQN